MDICMYLGSEETALISMHKRVADLRICLLFYLHMQIASCFMNRLMKPLKGFIQ